MKKPVVFFSHSARDADSLCRLKQRFTELTGSAFEVFLSSDGQSIQPGNNWVSSVEDALNEAKLMFTFLTPSSIGSSWLYFESGVAYARHIKVVPVGLLGVDVAKIPPPLSLLQGFNATDHHSLNNVIATVNRVFDHKHDLDFRAGDYAALVSNSSEAGRQFGEHGRAVANVSLSAVYAPASENRSQIMTALASLEQPPFVHLGRQLVPGASFAIDSEHFEVEIDAVSAPGALPIVERILHACSPRCVEPVLQVSFAEGVTGDLSAHRILARLQGSDIVPLQAEESPLRAKGLQLQLGEIVFSVLGPGSSNRFALLVHAGPRFDRYDWAALLSELFRTKVLTYAAVI